VVVTKFEKSVNEWKLVKSLCEMTIEFSVAVAVLGSATVSDSAAVAVASEDDVPEALYAMHSKDSPKTQKIMAGVVRNELARSR
jgi:hypothetical protein